MIQSDWSWGLQQLVSSCTGSGWRGLDMSGEETNQTMSQTKREGKTEGLEKISTVVKEM